mmetsp:Transcript_47481/g.54676  ORF Transcript_47481/g.54676 Transcript_47481/m.54676 type:complete len:113 (+) Transcript_47481:142-480(+)
MNTKEILLFLSPLKNQEVRVRETLLGFRSEIRIKKGNRGIKKKREKRTIFVREMTESSQKGISNKVKINLTIISSGSSFYFKKSRRRCNNVRVIWAELGVLGSLEQIWLSGG